MRVAMVILLALSLSCRGAGDEGAEYHADDAAVRYVGRVLCQSGGVSFDWSGTYLEFDFTGGYCAVRFSDTGMNYYNVFVDGRRGAVVRSSGRDSLVVLASGLSRARHNLRLQKRTEGEQGRATVHSFRLARGGRLLAVEAERLPKRHIEFIGNSLTCGYGVEGLDKNEVFRTETENCDLAFGCVVARFFDADYTLIAHSGQGAARNYGDAKSTSENTMRERMTRLFDQSPEPLWDFARSPHHPDIVVINLGTNDFSTLPHPSREEFLSAYGDIVRRLREAYGRLPVLCLAPPDAGPGREYIREFCLAAGDGDLHFADIPPGTFNDGSDLGSSAHPNVSGQRKMAMAIIPRVSTLTGWEIPDKPVN